MASVFCAVGLIYAIFWLIFLIKKRTYIPNYSTIELIVFYLLARGVPILMCQQHNMQMWLNLAMESIIFLLLIFYVRGRKGTEIRGAIYSFYLFQPAVILAVIFGSFWYILVVLAITAFLCALDTYIKKKNGSLITFVPEYILGSIGIFLWFVATELSEQTLADINSTTEIPVLYIVAIFTMGLAVSLAVYRFCKCEYFTEHIFQKTIKEENCECFIIEENKLQVKDILLMIIFTLIFSVIVLLKLGSFRVPETYWTLKQGQNGMNEIVLGFNSEVTMSKMYIYLGYQGKREISFSYTDTQSTEWTVFESGHIVESAFCWNEINVDKTMDKMGIVLLKGDANIHEIVCLDQYGNRILPSNAGYYSELFDEQALFPEDRTYFYRTMFDEVYHARTAYEFLNQLPIYENTHPPLGKSIISIGIKIFGMNPFGWRVMCALCGILMIPFMYLFAHKMFGTTKAASFATILLGTEFMHFTLSRIATIDIIVALFVLMMFYFMYGFVKKCNVKEGFLEQTGWLIACGCSMALAISTKWTGVYAVVGIAVIFFVFLWNHLQGKNGIMENRKYLLKLTGCCCCCFIVIPLIIYIFSYIPFTRVYTDKGLIKTVLDNAKLMLTYHVDTVFEHPYSSEWYEWLIDRKPLLDSYTVLKDGKLSTIATFGNPLILWIGLPALFHQFYLWRCKQCKNAQYLILAFGSVVMPWFFIHRTVFIYQYFLGILILILIIANSVYHLKEKNKAMVGISTISIGLFILFYPVISGYPVEADFVNEILEWMTTWKFAL